MSTIQNLKNFIRHGKQARVVEPPRDHPTTDVSAVHAQPQKHHAYGLDHQRGAQLPPGDASAGTADKQNVAAQTGGAAAPVAGKGQKAQTSIRDADLQAIVTEEREERGKLPRYPGLEGYELVQKMGDGAFSNVYRARDLQTGDEVAIKVVRRFEMNANQVRAGNKLKGSFLSAFCLARLPPFYEVANVLDLT